MSNLSTIGIEENNSYFLQLLKYLTKTDDMYIYLKSWLAHIIQKPYKNNLLH